MNGKKAKLFRKVGKIIDKKEKKMYNSLNHVERGILSGLYKHIVENNVEAISAQKKTPKGKKEPQINSIHPSGLNRKQRNQAAKMQQTPRMMSEIIADKMNEEFENQRVQIAEQNLADVITEGK